MSELDLVEKIRKRAGKPKGMVVGIGDDCALYRPRHKEDLLFTTDPLIEGVHFVKGTDASRVGERALARSLSDIAAMGGEPRFCLISLTCPNDAKWIDGFYRGLLKLAAKTHTTLAGGDLSHGPAIHCEVMVCGAVPRAKALVRSGAKVGDWIYVSAPLGKPWDSPIEPRLALGKKLRASASACMDISDGISLDLHRLCKASRVAAELDDVPVYPGATLERALHGGEDYELLWTSPRKSRLGFCVGRIVAGKPGLVRLRGIKVPPQGYDHFGIDIT